MGGERCAQEKTKTKTPCSKDCGWGWSKTCGTIFSPAVWKKNRERRGILRKVRYYRREILSLTLSHCCLFPSWFRDRIVRHALPILGSPGTLLGYRFSSSGVGIGFLELGWPRRQHRGRGVASATGYGVSPAPRPQKAQAGPARASAPVSSRSRGPRQSPGPSPGVTAPVC